MNNNKVVHTLNPKDLAKYLADNLPKIVFAMHLGSSQNGSVFEGSDVDIALYTEPDYSSEDYLTDIGKIQEFFGVKAIKLDLGVLNRAEPIYRFEALSGTILFCRNNEVYQDFFVATCKSYEMQMKSYERQHQYRVEYYEQGFK